MNLRPFEIVLIAAFFVLGIVGIFVLSNATGVDEKDKIYGDSVLIWGTLDENIVNSVLAEAIKMDKAISVIRYRQFDESSFDSEIINAIAEGNAPDLLILPNESLVTHRAKLMPIPYETLSERTFRDTYIDGADIFMMSDGTYGIPLMVDPLVVFWNRDIFSSSGLVLPPKTWEDLVAVTLPAVVQTAPNRDLERSVIAFGEYSNVRHAKDLLLMLLLQSGAPLVSESDKLYSVLLNNSSENKLPSAEAVLSFYTQFSNPTSASYTWNRTQPLDWNAFKAGTLGMYFGKSSEIASMQEQNPNLSFDIATVPQGKGATTLRNYGTFYALAIPRISVNRTGAYRAALALTSESNAALFADLSNTAPALRSLFDTPPANSNTNIIRQSALTARGWLDPSKRESGEIFRTAVEDISTGRSRIYEVINDVSFKLAELFR